MLLINLVSKCSVLCVRVLFHVLLTNNKEHRSGTPLISCLTWNICSWVQWWGRCFFDFFFIESDWLRCFFFHLQIDGCVFFPSPCLFPAWCYAIFPLCPRDRPWQIYNDQVNNEPGNYGAGFLGLRPSGTGRPTSRLKIFTEAITWWLVDKENRWEINWRIVSRITGYIKIQINYSLNKGLHLSQYVYRQVPFLNSCECKE